MRVRVVEVSRGRETVVAVVSLQRGRVLHACAGVGVAGAALAAVEAVAYCGRKGHVIVTPDAGPLAPANAERAA